MLCRTCNKDKPEEDFAIRKDCRRGRASECKECHRVVRRRYYERNKAIEIRNARKHTVRKRDWFAALKRGLKCELCSESHPATISFHHRDPSQKEFNLAGAWVAGYGRARILAEIEKCQVLCENCHRKQHWEMRKSSKG